MWIDAFEYSHCLNICLFLFLLFLNLFDCWYMCLCLQPLCKCRGVHVEIREQPAVVSSFLLLWVSGVELTTSDLVARTLTHWTVSSAHFTSLFRHNFNSYLLKTYFVLHQCKILCNVLSCVLMFKMRNNINEIICSWKLPGETGYGIHFTHLKMFHCFPMYPFFLKLLSFAFL